MKIDSVVPEVVLGRDISKKSRNEYDGMDEGGLFSKLFKKFKSEEEDDNSYYEKVVAGIGRSTLIDEMNDSDNLAAFTVDKGNNDIYVIFTQNYIILPGQDVIEYTNISRFGFFNVREPDFAQYAIDREDEPYDPNYVSEYDGEETFELDRFLIVLAIVDKVGLKYEYPIHVEIKDREEVRKIIQDRTMDDVKDFSDELVFDGDFADDPYDNMLFNFN